MTTASRTVGSVWILFWTSFRSTRFPATLTMPSARPNSRNRPSRSGWTSSPVTQNPSASLSISLDTKSERTASRRPNIRQETGPAGCQLSVFSLTLRDATPPVSVEP